MKDWFNEHWGWLPVIVIVAALFTTGIVSLVYYGRLGYHNERLCNSVGGVWIAIGQTNYTCARVEIIPLPHPKTPFQ